MKTFAKMPKKSKTSKASKTSQNPLKSANPIISVLKNLQLFLLALLPAILFAPRIVPIIALALIAVLSLPTVFKKLPLALPLYLGLSLLWSDRPSRGLLVLGLFLCILITALAYRSLCTSERGPLFRRRLKISLLIGASVASLFCWFQFFADLLGAPRDLTLLCSGCTKATFGFPHVNGFTLEPQFMGALLLAPIFLCLKDFRSNRLFPLLLCFFSATLFLTFSRGALFACLLGLCFALILDLRPEKTRLPKFLQKFLNFCQRFFPVKQPSKSRKILQKFTPYFLILISFGTVFTFQSALSASAALPDTPEPLEHLTNQTASSPITSESQNIRLRLWSDAFHVWKKSPFSILFGVGLGGSGPALHAEDPALGVDTELVQNEYLELLLELGFIGVLIILGTLFRLNFQWPDDPGDESSVSGVHLRFNLSKAPLVLASLVSLLFFSGLPNALQIYLLLFSGQPESPPRHLPPKTRAKGRNKVS